MGLLGSHSCLSHAGRSLYACCHLATVAVRVVTAAFLLLACDESCNHEISPIRSVWCESDGLQGSPVPCPAYRGAKSEELSM